MSGLPRAVVVVIDADGTVSVIGPFRSLQRASQYIADHPEWIEENGINATHQRMEVPE